MAIGHGFWCKRRRHGCPCAAFDALLGGEDVCNGRRNTESRQAGEKLRRGLVAVAEQTQQHEEHVDEVEIQTQRAQDGAPTDGQTVVQRGAFAHGAQLLRVIGRKAREHNDADDADGEIHGAVAQEDVDDAGQDNAPQPHDQKAAHAGQVTLGHRAVQAPYVLGQLHAEVEEIAEQVGKLLEQIINGQGPDAQTNMVSMQKDE